MKVVSFNINGIRARLHQLQALIDTLSPDIIGLQEIKVHNDMFPVDDIKAMGYHVYFHGQKGHYGVAMLCKQPALEVRYGYSTDTDDAQRRMITTQHLLANGETLTVMNGYFPQGENREHEVKFPAKQKFYADLMHHLNSFHTPDDKLIVMGDVNISPSDLDIGIGEQNRKRWLKTGKCSFLPEEREWLQTLLDWGFIDTFRLLYPELGEKYSWFDYRSKGFDDNRGLRIDVILATSSLAKLATESQIDYVLRGIEKPSDHAPIWTEFSLSLV